MEHNTTRTHFVPGDPPVGNGTVSVDRGGGGSGRASIAERRAATCGFNVERISTAKFRTSAASPQSSPAAVRSPFITIPDGISPSALLDSPVLLPNSQASPTTGAFELPLVNNDSELLNMVNPVDENSVGNVNSAVRSKSYKDLDSLPSFSYVANQVSSAPSNLAPNADVDFQHYVSMEPPLDFEFTTEVSEGVASRSSAVNSAADVNVLSNIENDNGGNLGFCHSEGATDKIPMQKENLHGEDASTQPVAEHQKGKSLSMGMIRTSEDGYNWRKYGQKQVKGSEYPRSYYKCTHPNCQVKKKVERSLDGQITEIIYKGNHNHLKPQPLRRPFLGSSLSSDETSNMAKGSQTGINVESGLVWRNVQTGSKDIKVGSDLRADRLERTSSASVVTDISDPLSITQGKSVGGFEAAVTPEISSALASHEDDNDEGATQGSISFCDDVDDDDDDDESESKRRKTESSFAQTNLSSRAAREPRVVVQIESEADILDDGYRWRKYGQKVVKGNPNPRSYYKCTTPGCSVRKHVERASNDLKYVIMTYEGKHNHEVPAARSSGQINSNPSNIPQSFLSSHPNLTLPRNSCLPKPEPRIQDITPPFDRKPALSNEYLSTSLRNLSTEMKFGSSSMYQMKFPPLQNTMPYRTFGLNSNHSPAQLNGSMASMVPEFPVSLPLNLPASANLSQAGYNINNNRKLLGSVPSFLPEQLLNGNDMQFLRPKQDQLKARNTYDASFSIVEHANSSSFLSSSSSSSSSVYQQLRGTFPP